MVTVVTNAPVNKDTAVTEKLAHSSIPVTTATGGRHAIHTPKYANVTMATLAMGSSAAYQPAALDHVHQAPHVKMAIVCVDKAVMSTILTPTDVRTTTNVHPGGTTVTNTPTVKTYRVASDVHVTKVIPVMASLAIRTTRIPVTNKGVIHTLEIQLRSQPKIQIPMVSILPSILS